MAFFGKIRSGKKEAFEYLSEETILIRKNTIILLIFIFLLVILYLFGYFLKTILENKLNSLTEKNKNLTLQIEKAKNSDLFFILERMEKVRNLLDNHLYWSGIFSFLERHTLPNVQFVSFSGDYTQKRIVLSAKTTNLLSMVRQILVFEQLDSVKNVEFSSVGFAEGGVNFTLTLNLSDNLWKK